MLSFIIFSDYYYCPQTVPTQITSPVHSFPSAFVKISERQSPAKFKVKDGRSLADQFREWSEAGNLTICNSLISFAFPPSDLLQTAVITSVLVYKQYRWIYSSLFALGWACVDGGTLNSIQTHKRFRGTLFIRTRQNQIQTNKRFKRTLIYYDTDSQSANFRGNPLRQATKRHLNNRSMVKNDEKQNYLSFLGWAVVFDTDTQSANLWGNPFVNLQNDT